MTTAQVLGLLREYQTLAVGIVGFAGVIITLIVNANLGRRQHDRQVRHDRTVVRVALKAELEAIARSYRDRIKTLEETESGSKFGGALLSLDTMTDVYKSQITHLGLLSAAEVQAVLHAYLLVQQLPERLAFLADKPQELPEILNPHMQRRIPKGYAWFENKNHAAMAQMHRNYLVDVERAITALSG